MCTRYFGHTLIITTPPAVDLGVAALLKRFLTASFPGARPITFFKGPEETWCRSRN